MFINTLLSIVYVILFLVSGGMALGFFTNIKKDNAGFLYGILGTMCTGVTYMFAILLLDLWGF